MDDHLITTCGNGSPAQCEQLLDPVTAELKIEFARLEREKREEEAAYKAFDDAVERALAPPATGSQMRLLSDALEKIRSVVDALNDVCRIIGDFASPGLLQQAKFWTAAFNFNVEALAKLSALLARSLRATLRIPIFLDGPELSGYKHRLR